MCGIVGLYLKNPDLRPRLGSLFAPMLIEMTGRGPDSAGFAIYRDGIGYRDTAEGEGKIDEGKISAYDPDHIMDLEGLQSRMGSSLGVSVTADRISSHVVLQAGFSSSRMREWLTQNEPALKIMSSGEKLEIYKEIGLPADVIDRFGVAQMAGSHMVGHTRMATESAVTTQGAHPFNTGDDLCLVHNGSLSNHNVIRRMLEKDQGLSFQTENDSEVAAGYLTWRLSQGASLNEALEAALVDLDGFFTFTVGTRQGFAVLRDPIACKPAVMAETDQWVAMASEYRSLAGLPGVEEATVWEPAPATVYSWGTA